MATTTHDVEKKLELARWRLRLAKQQDAPAWEAEVLQEIDELLDQLSKGAP